MVKEAVILAAGEGRRLRPFTEDVPKVMLPICNKPILEYVIDAVKKSGIEKIIVVVGYKKEVIQEYFKDFENINFVVQDKQLGTAHALMQAQDFIKGQFIVLAGDNIVDSNSILKLLKEKSDFSSLIKEHVSPSKYGSIFLEKGVLEKIVEKPREATTGLISTGVYKFPESVFERIGELTSQGVYDLTSVVQSFIKEGRKIKAVFAELWRDVVYPWDLLEVNATMLNSIHSSTCGTIERNVTLKGPVCIGEDTVIRSGSYIIGPVVIGENCEIGPNVSIFPSTSIGKNSVIHPFTEIRNSVIMEEVDIGSHSFVSNSIIGKGTRTDAGFSVISGKATVEIENEFIKLDEIGAMVGYDTIIGSHVVVTPGKIIGKKCRVGSLKNIVDDIASGSVVM